MRIIIFHGKHGDGIYDASTPLLEAAAKLEWMRIWGDYFGEPETEPSEWFWKRGSNERELAAITDEELANTPEALRTPALEARKKLADWKKQNTQDRLWWELFQKLIALPVAEALAHESKLSSGRTQNSVTWLYDVIGDGEYFQYEIETIEQAPVE